MFAPLEKLGLIVVDEEHENSYKQEDAPRYHARDVAVYRAHMEGCAIVLGSATPSMESYHNALTGKYELVQLLSRVDDRQMPRIRIVDLRHGGGARAGRQHPLRDALQGDPRAAREEGAIDPVPEPARVFNLAHLHELRACLRVPELLDVAHISPGREPAGLPHLRAYGGGAGEVPGVRATRASSYSGAGTEKVEELVAAFFPGAVVKRLDADAVSRKGSLKEALHAFRTGKIDILVGTQMIAKGLHFPNVTLVGIVNADMSLHLPDFRAGERTFQLLTQVAGRAGRGEVSGEVYVQTYTPFHPAIQFARHHDFPGFWEQEIEFRQKTKFPPFWHMVLVTLRSESESHAAFSADTLARRVREALEAGSPAGGYAWSAIRRPRPSRRATGNTGFT